MKTTANLDLGGGYKKKEVANNMENSQITSTSSSQACCLGDSISSLLFHVELKGFSLLGD